MCTQHLDRLINFQAKGQKTKTIHKRLYENCINSSLTKAHLRLSNFKGNTNCCIFRHTWELHFCLTTFWGWEKTSRVTASSLYIECISQAYKNHPWSLHLQIQAYTFLSSKCTRVLTEQILLLPAATFTSKADGTCCRLIQFCLSRWHPDITLTRRSMKLLMPFQTHNCFFPQDSILLDSRKTSINKCTHDSIVVWCNFSDYTVLKDISDLM